MGSIIASGVGSGLDIEGIVQQLLAAEGQPARQRLDAREQTLQAQLSAFGKFRSALELLREALDPLTTLARFQGRTTTIGNPALLSATASLDAATGSYSVEVVRLASAHKLASNPYTTADTNVGSGNLNISVGGDSFTVNIPQSARSLADIASAINSAPDNTGVRATLITANDGVRMILTANETGAANTISVTTTGGGGGGGGGGNLNAFVSNLTQITAAQDARVRVDGFTYDSSDNVITEVIGGLTLTLTEAAPGSPTTLAIGNDSEGSVERVSEFVKAYNELVKSLRELTAFNADSGTGGPLLGDPTARNFLNSVRSEVVRAITGQGSYSTLAEIGITTQVDGSLEIDTARLEEALGAGFDDVGRLFSVDETGLANRLDALLGVYVDSNGLISNRTEGIQDRIRDIEDARIALDFRLEKIEARLRAQFGALDALVAQLRQTSDFLTRQLDALLPTNQQPRTSR